MLIYFTQELQKRALQLFAYSLRDQGTLVLGKSESTSPFAEFFTSQHHQFKVYRRHGERITLPLAAMRFPAPLSSLRSVAPSRIGPGRTVPRLGDRDERNLLKLPVGMVVVDRRYDIRAINSIARRLLAIYSAALGDDLIHIAPGVPHRLLREAIDRTFRSGTPTSLRPFAVNETANDGHRSLQITCYAQRAENDQGPIETVLLIVNDVTNTVQDPREQGEAEAQGATVAPTDLETQVAQQAQQIARLIETNRQLFEANQEFLTTNDELRVTNDEFLLSIEEAQASTEEIETLNEELQSSNEELETLNEESQATVEELNVANEELQARASELEELATTHATEQARLTAVLAGMGDAVLVVDRQGRTLLANAAYHAMFEEGDAGPFVPADDRGVALKPTETPRARAARGEDFRMEFTAGGRDGPRGWYEVMGRPLDEQGAGILVVRDITDRSLRVLQEEFLSWAGHELRTPLSVLHSYLQLAIRRAKRDSDERLCAALESALTQARRQGTLIDELLDATRLRSGQLTLRRRRLNLIDLVREVVGTAQMLAKGQTIAVAAPDDPIPIDGDPGRLEQVLLNLLTNAIAYAKGTDRIEVTVGLRDGDGEVAVRDFGPGIAPEAMGRIFERFGRVPDATGSHSGGLGLGLYIARQIVREHDGDIVASSTPGAGALFTVRLPLADSQTATEPESNHVEHVNAVATDRVPADLAEVNPVAIGADD